LFYYQIRNRWHFMLKNYEVPTLAAILPALLVHEALQAVVLAVRGHGLTYLRALGGLIALLPTLPRDRALTRGIRRRRDRDLLVSGRLVVRADLAGGSAWLRRYEELLNHYWRLVRRLLPRTA
jgi:hypothetical protein